MTRMWKLQDTGYTCKNYQKLKLDQLNFIGKQNRHFFEDVTGAIGAISNMDTSQQLLGVTVGSFLIGGRPQQKQHDRKQLTSYDSSPKSSVCLFVLTCHMFMNLQNRQRKKFRTCQ